MSKPANSQVPASCPAAMSKKSSSPTPTAIVDSGTPATFCMDSPQEILEYLSRARAGIHKDKRTSWKKPWYLAEAFRRARKVVTIEGTKKNDPSNLESDVLPTKQNSSLVALPTSQAGSIVVSAKECYATSAKPQEHPATVNRSAPAPGKVVGVTRDQVQPVESIVDQDSAGAEHADEVPAVDASTAHDTDIIDPNSSPESPRVAIDRSSSPKPDPVAVSIPRKLRYSSSSPTLTATHSFRSVFNGTLVDSWPLSLTIPRLSPPSPITETGSQDEESEATQDSRASSPSGNLESSHLGRLYQVSDAYKARVSGAIQTLKYTFDTEWAERVAKTVAKAKAAQNEEWTERLETALAQAGARKDEEWAKRLEKAVTQAETAKDEELDAFDRFKESNHQNEIKDLEEDHEHQIQELKEIHAETLQRLTTKHEEELVEITKKHGAEARKLELRRTSGVKEVTRLKQELSEMEAEKTAKEKDLVHMTGQRDALHMAFVAMTGQHPPSHIDQDQSPYPQEVDDVDETTNREPTHPILAGSHISSQTAIPATNSNLLQPHPPAQTDHPSIVPKTLYPRVQILESENALLRTELDQRHQDVTYATNKSDNLRALLEADPSKSDIYADVLIYQETIQDLQTRLQESWEAAEREKLESTRLRERIDIVVESLKTAELGQNVAVADKEAAWARNENLLRDLKGVFGKSDFDTAFWTHYDSLVREKEGLEGDVKAYKAERHGLLEEAVESKAQISRLEFDAAVAASKADSADEEEGGLQHLRNQILTLRIENEALKAEVEFQVAEVENCKVGSRMPRGLKEVQEQVLEERNREIEELRARLGADGSLGGGAGNVDGDLKDQSAQGIRGCVSTPNSESSFF